MQKRYRFFVLIAGVLAFFLLSGFGLFKKNKKYDTPITILFAVPRVRVGMTIQL